MWVRILAVVAALTVVTAVAASAYFLVQPPAAAPVAGATAPPVARTTPPKTPRAVASAAPEIASPAPSPSPKAPAPTPPAANPVQAAPAGPIEQRVAVRLNRVFARAGVGPNVAVSVLDGQGRMVFGQRPSAPVLPASTQKLAVAAAALARLGPQHRYTTTVTASAQPNARGVLRGNLTLVGGGDPALAQPVFRAIEPDRPRTPMEQLVRSVKRAGIRRITGRIVGDSSFLAPDPVAAGWPGRYFDQLDATRITGLTVDAGRRVYTANGGLQADAAEDPAAQAARVFQSLLKDRGIKVTGRARVAQTKTNDPVSIGQVSSPPLGVILQYMVQRSDNHFADTVFRTLGAAAGDSTWIGAAQATADSLQPLRLDWTGIVLADGSGLSRANRVNATFMAQLHGHMWSSNLHEQWVGLLAVSANSGTLRSRLTGTVGAGRLYGKTGSLRDVVSLVGTVVGTDGRLMHLAIIGNDLQSTTQMRTATDAATLVVAEELQECRRVRPPPRKNGKKRPVQLVCGR